ncbi:hypothetical protein I316_06123 [Kwoniella heveanensis BCC8398]|uniref:Secretion-regulating guanine nucleotide exchange factor n=1 Tax=Kwoniella heveanensis BCC8398 TaxID=1296120 RepID=A0A1B9GM78_9TREE|nr:hypothetical protein I316_06123 [Kwoniella heveanensis BCC8398]
MPPSILACGSNAASHLAINHSEDVSTLTPTLYHPSIEQTIQPLPCSVLDLVSASAHSLLLLTERDNINCGKQGVRRNVLLGAGTNTYGQLGPRCALWEDVKPERRWKVLNLASPAGLEGEWEPVKIAATWTTSFVVYQRARIGTGDSSHDGRTAQTPSDPNNTASGLVSGSGSGSGSGSSTSINGDIGGNGNGIASIPNKVEHVVISTGSNDFGELGSTSLAPSTLGSNAPAQLSISTASINPTIVDIDLKPGERVELIKGGQRHVIAVIGDMHGRRQRVVGWGASRKGELDAATLSSSATPTNARTAPTAGKGKGKGKAAVGPPFSPPTTIDLPIPLNQRIIDITLGASHTLALLSDGTLLGWGSNLKGQITGVHQLRAVRGIAASWGGSYFLTEEGEVRSQGSNSHSQLLRGSGLSQEADGGSVASASASERDIVAVPEGWEVRRIVAGSEHLLVHAKKRKPTTNQSAASRQNEEEEALFSGGWNEHGNLGLGDQEDRNSFHRVEIDVGVGSRGQGQGQERGRGRSHGRMKGLWGGCASTWVWIDQDGQG